MVGRRNFVIPQHSLGFLNYAQAQRLRLQHACVLAPTEEPLDDLAFVAHLERDQQPFRCVFFRGDVVRTRFLHPARNLGIEEDADDYGTSFALTFGVMSHNKTGGALKRAKKDFQVVHAVEAEVADVLAQMAVGDEVPAARKMYQAVRVGLAGRLFALALARVAGVIAKAHGRMLDDGAAQLL